MKKSVSYWFLRTIVRVGMLKKKRKHLQKRNKKNIDFSLKKQPKWTRKTKKNELATKIDKKAALGTHFCEKKKRNWMDFGIPGETIGKALGGILGQKKGNEKNI